MIQLGERLWIGDSDDERHADLDEVGVGAVLNVAQDLHGVRGWMNGVEYAQVGLIDGPGNPPSAYYAAVAALGTLVRRWRTLVVCHTGSRALAVALMYLNVHPRRGWDDLLALVRERVDGELPVPHEAHRAAFDKLNWRVLVSALEAE